MLWNVGLVGLLIFGVALAIDIDAYELWDAWIIIAIVLWLAAGGAGDKLRPPTREAGGGAVTTDAVRAHWITSHSSSSCSPT